MKQYLDKYPYTVTSAVFLVVFIIGIVWFGWGQFALAYFVLLYCIVIIGIRLDDITRQLRDLGAIQTTLRRESGNRSVVTHETIEYQRLSEQLDDIKKLLAQIYQSLERPSQPPD